MGTNASLTKAELVAKGQTFSPKLNLKMTSLKGELVKAVNAAEKKASTSKASSSKARGEY
jgi:hypothetical protein